MSEINFEYIENNCIDELYKILEKRYDSFKRRGGEISAGFFFGLAFDILEKNDFKCEYCGRPLNLKPKKPFYLDAISIDHKIPLTLGGSNEMENLTIVCNCCNIIKGTMRSETYLEFLKYIPKRLLEKIFEEWFIGRFANKMGRLYD